MRFPWTKQIDKRAAEAELQADAAAEQLQRVREMWPRTLEAATEAHRQRQLNGWTETVKAIFGGNR